MPTSPQLSLKDLENRLVQVEAEALILRNLYILTRDQAMDGFLKQRNFDFCCDQGLTSYVEDGDLQAKITRQLNHSQAIFSMIKRCYLETEKEAEDLRTTIRILKEHPPAQ
jgi:hypothetical protein